MIESDRVKINDLDYYYSVILTNLDNNSIALNPSVIKHLEIIDDIYEFAIIGHIVFENENDTIHRAYNNDVGEEIRREYNFNLSNYDCLYVDIIPKLSNESDRKTLDEDIWRLRGLYMIYDIEDYYDDGAGKKYKKLHFWSYQYEVLRESNVPFSTVAFNDNSSLPVSQREDEDKRILTGVAIKELLKASLNIGDDLFVDDWDDGKNEIFYTSSPKRKNLDDLLYLYNYHQSSDNDDFSLLYMERNTNKWVLLPFYLFFEKALDKFNKAKSGENQIERFVVPEIGDVETIPQRNRIPTDHGSLKQNFYFADYSNIDNFSLTDIAKFDLTKWNTRVSHSYDFSNGTFKIQHDDISEIKDYFKTNYADRLKKRGFINFPIFPLDETRETNFNISHDFVSNTQGFDNMNFHGINKVLKSSYLGNLVIDFTTTGLTFRQAGFCFSVGKDVSYVESEYESRLQGQWFCTQVKHIFTSDTYHNEITGVKINKFEEGTTS